MATTERVLIHSDGPSLWPERFPEKSLVSIQKTVGPYFFSALYQGLPRPKGGDFFQRTWFTSNLVSIHDVPPDSEFCRGWDKASTKGGGDWSVSVLMAKSKDGRYFIVNVTRDRLSSFRRDEKILATAEEDLSRWGSVHIRGDQDPGSAGKDDAEAFRRLLEQFWVTTATVTGDKQTRARPFASAAEGGNVYMVKAPWNEAYLDVLEAFPNGKNDDDVDGSSSSYNELAKGDGKLRKGPSPTHNYEGRLALATSRNRLALPSPR